MYGVRIVDIASRGRTSIRRFEEALLVLGDVNGWVVKILKEMQGCGVGSEVN